MTTPVIKRNFWNLAASEKPVMFDVANRALELQYAAEPEPVDEQTEWVKIEGVDHEPRYEQVVEVDPHAALRAEYAKQVAEGTVGFYLWECDSLLKPSGFVYINTPEFYSKLQYRCTDISCMVALKGEPAKRMLRTEAQKLQRELGDTVEWVFDGLKVDKDYQIKFDRPKEVYAYKLKPAKQPKWTGSRDDVLALLKEKGLL
jgi:hypothetical protein